MASEGHRLKATGLEASGLELPTVLKVKNPKQENLKLKTFPSGAPGVARGRKENRKLKLKKKFCPEPPRF